MLSTGAFIAIAALFALLVTQAAAGDVYAHFIVGNAGIYTQSDWAKDIAVAADSKIDGFALNIGHDPYTDTQLGYAYAAAEAHGNFKLFISFDYNANNNQGFSASEVESTVNKYKVSSAQAQYSGKPLVSTFEGPSYAGDWPGIKSSTGCFFIPDWTSAKGTPSTFSVVDGALSWDIWPTTAADMTDANDKAWQSLLDGKAYMMGISPWFYANLPNKNWLWRSNGLWYERWQQALEIQPELIEIVTWNDFGESSYIGPIVQSEVVPGAEGYVNNNPHDGWRALLPYYIDAYKNGNQASTPTVDILSWAHQPNPVNACGTGGTTGGPGGGDPTQYAEDLIDVDVALSAPADVSVTIGGGAPTTKSAVPAGISHFQVPFNGQTGQVVYTVSRNGATVMTVQGTTISSDCTTVNWNAVTGSQTASGSSGSSTANNDNSTCIVSFDAKDTTVYGENIFIAGDDAALGRWDTDKALALNADQYTADNPLWEGSVRLPAGSTVTYRYFKKGTDGSTITWQGANRTLTVPESCTVVITQSDTVA